MLLLLSNIIKGLKINKINKKGETIVGHGAIIVFVCAFFSLTLSPLPIIRVVLSSSPILERKQNSYMLVVCIAQLYMYKFMHKIRNQFLI